MKWLGYFCTGVLLALFLPGIPSARSIATLFVANLMSLAFWELFAARSKT